MKKDKKQYIIPVFIPHLGCPNDCSFCNQKSISGKTKMPTKDEVIKVIEEHLKNMKEDVEKEIAFFGGSFTGIEIDKLKTLIIEAIDDFSYSNSCTYCTCCIWYD